MDRPPAEPAAFPHPRLVLGLTLLLFLPAILAVLFLHEIRLSFERRCGEDAELRLRRVAQVMATGTDKPTALGLVIRRIELEYRWLPTPASMAVLARMILKRMPIQPRVFCFDPEGRMLFPRRSFADRTERERLWRAMSATRALSRTASSRRQTPGELPDNMAFIRSRYDPFMDLRLLSTAYKFENFYLTPENEKVFLAISFLQVGNGRGYAGFQIEVWESRITPEFIDGVVLSLKPEDIAAAILARDGQVRGSTGIPLPGGDLRPDLASDSLGITPNYHLYRIGLPGNRSLLLARPRPWLAGLPPAAWPPLEACLLVLGGWAGWSIARRICYPERFHLGLRGQILGGLLLASSFSLLGLMFLGLERVLDIDTFVLQTYRNRLQALAGDHDLQFQNLLESRQTQCRSILSRLSSLMENPRVLREEIRRVGSILNPAVIDLTGTTFVFHKQKLGKAEAKDYLEKVFHLMANDLLEDFQPVDRPNRRQRPRMGLQMFLGDNILVDFEPRIGTINRLIHQDRFLLEYHDFLRVPFPAKPPPGSAPVVPSPAEGQAGKPPGKIIGLGLIQIDPIDLADQYLEKVTRGTRPQHPGPFFLGGLAAGYHPAFLRDSLELKQSGQRVAETREPEEFQITVASHSYLVWLQPPRFFPEKMIGGAVSLGRLTGHREGILATMGLTGAVGGGIMLLAGTFLFLRILKPLRDLAFAGNEVAAGRFQTRLRVESADELGGLAWSFNAMTTGLQERERMRRFVSDSLWETTATGAIAGGRREEAAVLFSDIRSFTTLSETHPPTEIVEMLNEYFTLMDQAIREEYGEIDKFIGDAVFAVFRAHPDHEDPCRRAVRAGLAMRRALAAMNNHRRGANLWAVDNGIGIDFGPVILGRVGAETGRSDFTCMGGPVARAAALEARSKEGTTTRVVVSETVIGRLPPGFSPRPLPSTGDPAWEIDSLEVRP